MITNGIIDVSLKVFGRTDLFGLTCRIIMYFTSLNLVGVFGHLLKHTLEVPGTFDEDEIRFARGVGEATWWDLTEETFPLV